jgi:uncharacterized protein (UPF0147 family)
LPQEDWGYDMRDGVVTRVEGEELVEETLLTIPGNYPAYYAAIRDALNGTGENPVPASQAIQIMELIELGSNLPNIAPRSVWHKFLTLL